MKQSKAAGSEAPAALTEGQLALVQLLAQIAARDWQAQQAQLPAPAPADGADQMPDAGCEEKGAQKTECGAIRPSLKPKAKQRRP